MYLLAAKSVGIVHGSPTDCLRTVRAEVSLFTNDLNEDGEEELAKNYRFLDSECVSLLVAMVAPRALYSV